MPLWVRTLALALVLSTSGAFQAAEAAFELFEECSGDEEGCDCSESCASACSCCPARTSLPAQAQGAAVVVAIAGAAFAGPGEPVVAASAADIFHPPRA